MAPPTSTPDQTPAITMTVEEHTPQNTTSPKRRLPKDGNSSSSKKKPRRRHNRYSHSNRYKCSTLICSREQRNRHLKAPDSFDVEATLDNGTVIIVGLIRTELGWKDWLKKIVYLAPYTDVKQDVFTRVCNEYVLAEDLETILDWMKTDFVEVRLLN